MDAKKHVTKRAPIGRKKFPAAAPEEEEPTFFLSQFQLSNELIEAGEYLAEVSSMKEDPNEPWKSKIKFKPFDDTSGKRIYFEDVYLTLDRTNVASSAAGQFLTLFQKARHWGDIQNRVVGLEIKLNPGRDGRIFKNVVGVFETDRDPLIFDDKHMVEALTDVKTVDDINGADEEEEAKVEVASPGVAELLDDDEDEDDLELEEED